MYLLRSSVFGILLQSGCTQHIYIIINSYLKICLYTKNVNPSCHLNFIICPLSLSGGGLLQKQFLVCLRLLSRVSKARI
jgi:hypothetical protein